MCRTTVPTSSNPKETMASKFEDSDEIVLKRVRLDHFSAWKSEPSMEASKKDNPEFNRHKVKAIVPKESDAATAAKNGLLQAARKMWGDNASNVLKALPMNSKALRNGDEYLKSDGGQREEYKGNYFISAGNKSKPATVAQRRITGEYEVAHAITGAISKVTLNNPTFIDIAEDGKPMVNGLILLNPPYKIVKPYRGCIVNIKMRFTAMAAGAMTSGEKVGNQVFGKWLALQFVEDGDPFGSAGASAEGFDDEDAEEAEGSDLF